MNIAKYDINKDFVRRKYHARKTEDLVLLIAELACSTMCPSIAVAYWIGEVADWPEEVVTHIKTLIKFYNYKVVVGKPLNSPV